MGRPLNDRFFGNRNIGSVSTSTDNGIGGEGVASVSFSDAGSWMATAGVPLAGLQLPAPTLPSGVQAAWTNYFGAEAVTTGAGKADLYADALYTYTPYPGSSIKVASTASSNATFTVLADGSTTTLLTDTQGVYLTKVSGLGTSTFLVDVFTHIVQTVITEPGSGYNGTETFTVTTANGATGGAPAGTIVLTVDSGIQNPSQNPAGENANAIVIHANTTGAGTKVGDIQKQVGSRRYKVRTADGVARCGLVSTGSPAVGEAYIVATDSTSHTYYVTKLTAHRATLVPFGSAGHEFPLVADGLGGYEPVSAGWVFSGAVLNKSVVIENS
jgi:hypothetical protein